MKEICAPSRSYLQDRTRIHVQQNLKFSFAMSVHPSTSVEEIVSHWTDLYEIELRIFQKYLIKFKFN